MIEKTIYFDQLAESLGIQKGNTYSFDLFFAERHTTQSNFMFQTNLNLKCIATQCSDGIDNDGDGKIDFACPATSTGTNKSVTFLGNQ